MNVTIVSEPNISVGNAAMQFNPTYYAGLVSKELTRVPLYYLCRNARREDTDQLTAA